MKEEKLLLTQRDRDRLKVLHEVGKGHLTQRQASEQLKLTDRWVRKMLQRIKERGDRAVVHGLRGRASTRRIEAKVEKQAVELVGREYARRWPASI
jgi:DNA-binding Lrp family transcriptional regulator